MNRCDSGFPQHERDSLEDLSIISEFYLEEERPSNLRDTSNGEHDISDLLDLSVMLVTKSLQVLINRVMDQLIPPRYIWWAPD